MKQRWAIINSVVAGAILLSMLLQSLHSFEHLSKLFSEKECHHKYSGHTEISHQHHSFDECFVCEFTLNSFVSPEVFSFTFQTPQYAVANTRETSQNIIAFSGSHYSLRGPPVRMV